MFREAWLWASEKPRVQRFVTGGRLTKTVVERFVAGDDLDDAIRVIKDLNRKGIKGILDLLGEGVVDPAGAQGAADAYLEAIRCITANGIDTTVSVKPTQLGLAFDKGACLAHLRKLSEEAAAAGTRIEIDMEQSGYVPDTLEVFRELRRDHPDVRLAIQAMLRRTPVDLVSLAEERPPRVRLVKGAYSEPPEIAFQKRKEIDAQYRFLTSWLFEHGDTPAIASHDTTLIEHAQAEARASGKGLDSFEIQMLYGIRRELQERLAQQGHQVYVYVPYGSAWYPYLMRRIAERPANLRFFMRAVVRD